MRVRTKQNSRMEATGTNDMQYCACVHVLICACARVCECSYHGLFCKRTCCACVACVRRCLLRNIFGLQRPQVFARSSFSDGLPLRVCISPAPPGMSARSYMDERNCALAFYYRNPPPMSDARPLPYNDICSLVRKKNGKQPSLQAAKQAVANFREPCLKRGRKPGWRKSSPGEDNLILKTMLRLRGDGLGVSQKSGSPRRAEPRR